MMKLPFRLDRRKTVILAVGGVFLLLAVIFRFSGDEPAAENVQPPAVAAEAAPSSADPASSAAPAPAGGAAETPTTPTSSAAAGPQIRLVRVTPLPAFPGSVLKAEAEGTDAQGNALDYEYEWRRNDEVLAGQTSAELDTTGFRKGDLIVVTVTPYAGRIQGESYKSFPQLLHNRPPTIVSLPEGGLENGRFRYQVKAEDPDGDRLTYTLDSAPEGMAVNSDTGLIEWPVPAGADGKKTVRVIVSDGDAKAFQSFGLDVRKGDGK